MQRLLLLAMILPATVQAQITPSQTYNGVNKPLYVNVSAPRNSKNLVLHLYQPDGTLIDQKSTTTGKQDLNKIFTDFWQNTHENAYYVQLYANKKPIGPALVLQSMFNPTLSRLAADGKTIEFVPDEDGPMFNGFRAYKDQNLLIETSFGNILFKLRPDAAPNTAWNIMELAKGGLYTNTIFHRVVAKRQDGTPFVIQGGDPTGTGSGGPGFAYALEKSTLQHDFGVISIARSTDPNTNGCQFFICLSREGTKHLDERYAAFGQAISGADVIQKIAAVPVGENDRPNDPPKIKNVRLVDAAPFGTGPKPVTKPN